MSKITKTSSKGIELIKSFEGFFSKPYLCPANVVTIGYGTTRYPNGKKVTLNDSPITEAVAIEYLKDSLIKFERDVDAFCRDDINQNQFDAIVSFCYNVGSSALKSSTLLKKLNVNPNDPNLVQEFAKWNKGGGKILKGLVRRRKAEANLYFA
jgi:lysozyme